MTLATISSKNQIVLPNEYLKILRVVSGDKLMVYSEGEEIRLKPIRGSIVDLVAGSIKVPKDKMGIPFEKVLEATKKIVAKHLVENE